MSEQFYRDLGDAEVERLAREICIRRGFSPDELIPDNGYSKAPLIPAWWKYQDRALDFLAMCKATNITPS